MTRLALLRHGPTAWNTAGRMQGRADIPLDGAGRARVAGWRLPDEFRDFTLLSSPLVRAVETARLLGATAGLELEPRLIETDWGEWEGRTLTGLRQEPGAAMAENEARGLDFRPPGGESPREVRDRLGPWLAEVAADPRPRLAVTHKGVIRALLSLATGWDMTGPPPTRLVADSVHLFALDETGRPVVERLNIPLVAGQ